MAGKRFTSAAFAHEASVSAINVMCSIVLMMNSCSALNLVWQGHHFSAHLTLWQCHSPRWFWLLTPTASRLYTHSWHTLWIGWRHSLRMQQQFLSKQQMENIFFQLLNIQESQSNELPSQACTQRQYNCHTWQECVWYRARSRCWFHWSWRHGTRNNQHVDLVNKIFDNQTKSFIICLDSTLPCLDEWWHGKKSCDAFIQCYMCMQAALSVSDATPSGSILVDFKISIRVRVTTSVDSDNT